MDLGHRVAWQSVDMPRACSGQECHPSSRPSHRTDRAMFTMTHHGCAATPRGRQLLDLLHTVGTPGGTAATTPTVGNNRECQLRWVVFAGGGRNTRLYIAHIGSAWCPSSSAAPWRRLGEYHDRLQPDSYNTPRITPSRGICLTSRARGIVEETDGG